VAEDLLVPWNFENESYRENERSKKLTHGYETVGFFCHLGF